MVFCFLSKRPHISFHFALGPANYVAGPAKTAVGQNLQAPDICCPWSPRSARLWLLCLQLHFFDKQCLLPVFSPSQVTVVVMILKHILLFPHFCTLPSHQFSQHFWHFRDTNKPIKKLSALAGFWRPAVRATTGEPQARAATSQQDAFSPNWRASGQNSSQPQEPLLFSTAVDNLTLAFWKEFCFFSQANWWEHHAQPTRVLAENLVL